MPALLDRAPVSAPTIADTGGGILIRNVDHDFVGRSGVTVEALRDIQLEIPSGEFVAVVGPSGCGKTTLLRLIAGFAVPTAGDIHVFGCRVRQPSAERGVVFQQPNLYPWLSVRDNVAFGPRMRGISKSRRRTLADHYMDMVGIGEFGDAAPYELSGGMRQRCQIAAVLANDPDVMLLDEPFGALDALTREHLQDELLRIWCASQKTAVFITHSVEEAVYLATRVVVMSPRPGRILADVPVPFEPSERTAQLRTTRTFLQLREQIDEVLRAGLAQSTSETESSTR